jgi:DGQHR domain-containing protein
MASISISAIKIQQPIGEFFIAAIPSKELCAMARADVRRIKTEQREVEKYLGIQRPLNDERVEEIKEYVRTKDATFPTAIILAVKAVCAKWDEQSSTLTLAEYKAQRDDEEDIPLDRVANILDGQHRLAGLKDYERDDFVLNVSIFVDADIAEQANVFATVNLAQTKVNKSLVYDLFELAKTRSPQKTCHNVAVALDAQADSPFAGRVKRLGVATEGRFNETLTQATIVESLLRYISTKPNVDRDLLLRGKKLKKAEGDEQQKLIFRNLFIDERDADITKIVWTYFLAVKERWPTAWNNMSRGNILPKTNGFRAFVRFLRPVYISAARKVGEQITVKQVQSVLTGVTLTDDDFNIDNFPPGTSGEAALLRRLSSDTGLPAR